MVRLLYVIGTCAWLTAGAVLMRIPTQWRRADSDLEPSRDRSGVIEAFRERRERPGPEAGGQMASPLLTQAQAFADYLNPPVVAMADDAACIPVEAPPMPAALTSVGAGSPVSAKFRVVAVSCYPQRPERSMALIEPMIGGEAKWVKEGEQVGHFVVQEIRQGLVVLRNGESAVGGCELAVERNHTERTLVRDVRPGSRQVSAAGPDGTVIPLIQRED